MRTTDTEAFPTLAFVDVETTGLSPAHGDRICEIAVLRVEGDGTETAWETLVHPRRPISPAAAAVNGITDDMIAGAPTFDRVAPRVLELLAGAVLVCHNAPFDTGFLSSELRECGLLLPDMPVIDTLKVARRYFRFPSNSLGSIAAGLSLDIRGQHRAMADVRTTARVFAYFREELARQGVDDVAQLYDGTITPPVPRDAAVQPLLEEAIRHGKTVSLSYLSREGTASVRTVRPLRIVVRFDYLYLEGVCALRRRQRTFRLDRITAVRLDA